MTIFILPIRHIMSSPVVTIGENALVIEAVRKMMDNDIECLVIPTLDQKVAGILTFRDIVEKMLSLGRSPAHTKVEEIMTRKVKTCRTTATVGEVIKMMKKYRLRRVPVVDERERLVGIVTNFDVACLGLDVSSQTG